MQYSTFYKNNVSSKTLLESNHLKYIHKIDMHAVSHINLELSQVGRALNQARRHANWSNIYQIVQASSNGRTMLEAFRDTSSSQELRRQWQRTEHKAHAPNTIWINTNSKNNRFELTVTKTLLLSFHVIYELDRSALILST